MLYVGALVVRLWLLLLKDCEDNQVEPSVQSYAGEKPCGFISGPRSCRVLSELGAC